MDLRLCCIWILCVKLSLSIDIFGGTSINGITYGDMSTTFSITELFPQLNGTVVYVIQEDKEQTGSYYISTHTAIYRLDSQAPNRSQLFAGHDTESGFCADPGADARFDVILDMIQMPDKLIISDFWNHCLRAIRSSTTASIAGMCGEEGDVDGRALTARFKRPYGLQLHKDYIFISDSYNRKIKEFNLIENLVTSIHQSQNFELCNFVLGQNPEMLEFYVTVKHGVVHIQNRRERMLVGNKKGENYDTDGQFSGVAFRDPQGIAWLDRDNLLVASEHDQTVKIISIKKWVVDSICDRNGWWWLDGNIRECKMTRPYSLAVTDTKIYIGESAENGGGVRELPYSISSSSDNSELAAVCSEPPVIESANHDQADDTAYTINMEVSYSCRSGYTSTGSASGILVCAEYNGQTYWLGDHIKCKMALETIVMIVLGTGWFLTLLLLITFITLYCKQRRTRSLTNTKTAEPATSHPGDNGYSNEPGSGYMSADAPTQAHEYNIPSDYSVIGYERTEPSYLYPESSGGEDTSAPSEYPPPIPSGNQRQSNNGYEDMAG